ncbi:MAG: hypothetical protein ACRDT4_09165, partial [Micromonosporaceae bacterium]
MYGRLVRRALRVLVSPGTWRRWAHLILGGALLMPYWLAMSVLAQVLAPAPGDLTVGMIALLTVAVIVPLLATAFIPGVRALEVTAARELLRPDAELTDDAPPGWRTPGWFAAHLAVGGVISGISLSLPPFALVVMALPFGDVETPMGGFRGGPERWWGLPAGLAMLLALVYLAAAAGAGLARLAPVLL